MTYFKSDRFNEGGSRERKQICRRVEGR